MMAASKTMALVEEWATALAACSVPDDVQQLQADEEKKKFQYIEKINDLAREGAENMLHRVSPDMQSKISGYKKFIATGIADGGFVPEIVQHVRNVVAKDPDAAFHIYSHKGCLEGSACMYVMEYMANTLGLKVAMSQCIIHSDKIAGARFAAKSGEVPVRNVLAADIPNAAGDVLLNALDSIFLADHHPGRSLEDTTNLCQVCGEKGGIVFNACKYNDLRDLKSCPCGLSILVDKFGGFSSGLLPPMLSETLFHAIWITDFFDHQQHPLADPDVCLLFRTYMSSGPKKVADATPERFAMLMESPEEMRDLLQGTVDVIPTVVTEVVRKWGKRELIAIDPTGASRIVMVDLTSEVGGLDDLMLYQMLIDTFKTDGIKTLWITKERQGPTKMRFGFRRAGDSMECGDLADTLQAKWPEDVSAGGHPYASVCTYSPDMEGEVLAAIEQMLGVVPVADLWAVRHDGQVLAEAVAVWEAESTLSSAVAAAIRDGCPFEDVYAVTPQCQGASAKHTKKLPDFIPAGHPAESHAAP